MHFGEERKYNRNYKNSRLLQHTHQLVHHKHKQMSAEVLLLAVHIYTALETQGKLKPEICWRRNQSEVESDSRISDLRQCSHLCPAKPAVPFAHTAIPASGEP